MKKLSTVLLVIILTIATLPTAPLIKAENNFNVTCKTDQLFFVGQEITAAMLDITYEGEVVDEKSGVVIKPNTFAEAGTYTINVTYQRDTSIHNQDIDIKVIDVVATQLEADRTKVSLVRGQNVTISDLPDIYLRFNNGVRKKLEEYNFVVDWENSLCTITYGELSTTIDIEIKENELTSISVSCAKESISEGEKFELSDITVIAYYSNGSNQQITQGYTIMPYTLISGKKTRVTIAYENVTNYFDIMVSGVITSTDPTNNPAVSTSAPGGAGTEPVTKTTVAPTGNQTMTTPTNSSQPLSATQQPSTTFTDTEAPVTNIVNGKKYIKSVTILAEDLGSGIASITITGTGTNKNITSGTVWKKVGNYTLVIIDNSNNKKEVDFSIEKSSVKKDVERWYNENTTVTISNRYSFKKVTVQGKNKPIKKGSKSFKVRLRKNGDYEITGISVQGKKHTYILHLDKKAPTITGVVDGTIYNHPVIVQANDNMELTSVKINGSKQKSLSLIKEAGKYTVEAEDKAGNKKVVSFEINYGNNTATSTLR